MSIEDLSDSLGLSNRSISSTQGLLFSEQTTKFLEAIAGSDLNDSSKLKIANGFYWWCAQAPPQLRIKTLTSIKASIYDIVSQFSRCADDVDSNQAEKKYEGIQCWVAMLLKGVDIARSMDTSCKLASEVAPTAYTVAETLLDSGVPILERNTKSPGEQRADTLTYLIALPWAGRCYIPNGLKVLKTILTGDYPSHVKGAARNAINSMGQVNKEGLKNCASEVIAIATSDSAAEYIVMTLFSTVPDLYLKDPEAVHSQLDLIMKMEFKSTSTLVYTISTKHPKVLAPYINTFIALLEAENVNGALILRMVESVASANPDVVYPYVDTLQTFGATINGGFHALVGIIGHCGLAHAEGAADVMFLKLLDLLKNNAGVPLILNELNSLKNHLTSKQLLLDHLPLILAHGGSSDIITQAIDDYAHGRSLKDIYSKYDDMNEKVALSCNSFEDVLAYVDANIKDMKDFVGDVVKKLPQPRRLEVVGTLRKTLLLHFECVHSGYEFAIESHEWSKWLKMGFSLLKAGKAVIDIGMGNPIGLMSTGVECVRGIYEAYKTNDDDEFNAYIKNPFLTSGEQDTLIEKLRAQKFFDKFGYDSQVPGWYLIDHHRDGKLPEGQKGSVTKVRSKEGYGVTEGVQASIAAAIDFVAGGDTLNDLLPDSVVTEIDTTSGAISSATTLTPDDDVFNLAVAVSDAVGALMDEAAGSGMDKTLKASRPTAVSDTNEITGTLKVSEKGNRAATLKGNIMARRRPSGVGNNTYNTNGARRASADGQAVDRESMAKLERKMSMLEAKIARLEKDLEDIQIKSASHGCRCS